MNDLQRFLAGCRGEDVDYVPIFGFPGAGGVAQGVLTATHHKLVVEGMPEWVDGAFPLPPGGSEGWFRYWGTTGPMQVDFFPGQPPKGIQSETRREGKWEII